MQLLSDIGELRGLPGQLDIALGVFDGVHLGHAQVIGGAVAGAGTPVLVTFEPHPVRILVPDRAPKLITPLAHKARLAAGLRIEAVLAVRFDNDRAAQGAREFIAELASAASLGSVSVGQGFRFGRGREGDLALLTQFGIEFGFDVKGTPPVCDQGGEVISSTRVRAALEAGDLGLAERLLGRPCSVLGEVVHGALLGGKLGYPTTNVVGDAEQLPPNGVYAVRVDMGGAGGDALPGVANLGFRPTVDGAIPERPLLEVHLLDFDRDIYGREIEVAFVEWIRDEKKFDGLEALKAQIASDVVAARRSLA